MKKKHNLKIIVIGAIIVFALTVCDNGNGNLGNGGNNLFSGSFSSYTFSVKSTAGLSRTIGSSTTVLVSVLVKASNGKIYELHGFYDKENGNFSCTGSIDDQGFELCGNLQDGTAKIKTKSGTEWGVIDYIITFNDAINVEGNSETMAEGLPESWWGMYDYSVLADAQNPMGVET